MELYVNSADRIVTLEVPVVPVSGSLNVMVYDDLGVLRHTVNTVTAGSGTLSFTFPFSLSQYDGEYTVKWDFKYMEDGTEYTYTSETAVNVVTPILPLSVIAGVLGEGLNTPENVATAEAAVRTIIQAHTGQKFGYAKDKTILVEGHGEGALRLPERLIKLTGLGTMTSNLDTRAAIIVSDGWYLKKSWANATPRVATEEGSGYWGDISEGPFDNTIYDDSDDGYNPGYNEFGILVDPTLTPVGTREGGVITAPGATGRATAWKDDYKFAIRGDWGYKSVPTAVQEAAKLLVNDYGCSEAVYRDRYLESIKAADWRLQFSSQAWEHTGNARADQLLSEFVLLDWAVV
jgi:hypothetical protein